MKTNIQDYMGKKNNMLTVIGFSKPERGRTKLRCSCECGGEKLCFPYQFTSGDVKSCGCLTGGKKGRHDWDNNRKTHGLSKHPFYKKWNDMIRRCYNKNEPAYRFYGDKGIGVCEEWRETPEAFVAWCTETYPKGKKVSLDRIDGTKDYSPSNCRWATQLEQVHNLRNNRFVTVHGETHCVSEWSRLYKISPGAIYSRVKKGLTFDQAISELLNSKRR